MKRLPDTNLDAVRRTVRSDIMHTRVHGLKSRRTQRRSERQAHKRDIRSGNYED